MSIAKLIPEIKKQVHLVGERQVYKLLYPLAQLSGKDQLTEVVQREIVDVMRKDGFSNGFAS